MGDRQEQEQREREQRDREPEWILEPEDLERDQIRRQMEREEEIRRRMECDRDRIEEEGPEQR